MNVTLADAECCAPTKLHLEPRAADNLVDIAKALADPVRLQIVDVLRSHGAPICACDLLPLFQVSQPTLSHHLKKLRESGLVAVERRGKWAYFSVDETRIQELRTWAS